VKRLPWNWTATECQAAWEQYQEQSQDNSLPYRTWLAKHRTLELACESSVAPFINTQSISEELFV